MTKRFGNFQNLDSKKIKLNDDLDDLWGDDLDDDAFDDCVRVATQVEEKIIATQSLNSSLANYSVFKKPDDIFCSTQLTDVQKLRSQYEEKVGEVSVLRNQLQEIRVKHQIEQEKKLGEWKEKLNVTQREMQSMRSELEFKNLEISNLKQKVLNVSKHSFDIPNSSKIRQDRILQKPDNKIQIKNEPIVPLNYPLTNLDLTIFDSMIERQEIRPKYKKQYRNTIPYLQNQVFHEYSFSKPTEQESLNPEIISLVQCSKDELNRAQTIPIINQLIFTSIKFLLQLKNHLELCKVTMRDEDIQQLDSRYLSNKLPVKKCKLFERDKLGIKAGQTVYFLAHLLPHCKYLTDYLVLGKKLIANDCDIPESIKRNKLEEHCFYLDLLYSCLEIIGQIRKSHEMSGFLYSIVVFLTHICKSNNFDHVWYNVCKISKEILFAKPTSDVVCEMSYLLKHASHQPHFIEYMFKKTKNTVKMNPKRGVFYFNQDSCCFYVFAMLFVNSVFRENHRKFPLKICLNMLSFIYNTFKWSPWLHHKDTKHCECLAQLYKLEIDLIFKILMIYNKNIKLGKLIDEEWSQFFNHEITIKVLNLMAFNSYELTEKYVSVYAQFKEIQRNLPQDKIEEIESLVLSEDIPKIPSNHSGFNYL